jgi:hypothetical protein
MSASIDISGSPLFVSNRERDAAKLAAIRQRVEQLRIEVRARALKTVYASRALNTLPEEQRGAVAALFQRAGFDVRLPTAGDTLAP